MSLTPAYPPLNWVNLNPGAAAVTILNQTRTGEQTRALQGSIVVTGLSGAGSILTVTRSVGGVAQIAVPFVLPIGQTSIEIPIAPFVARDALAVGFTLRSDNAADSSVSGSTTLWPSNDDVVVAALSSVISLAVAGEKTPFLNVEPDPDRILDVSTRTDGYLVHGAIRTTPGSRETWWLRRLSGRWWAGMELPVSSDETKVAVIDEEAGQSWWGVNRDLVGVTIETDASVEPGEALSLAVSVSPTPGSSAALSIPVRVI